MVNQGDRIGDYILEKSVGKGAFGTVWRAVNDNSKLPAYKELVAIKIIEIKDKKDETDVLSEAGRWAGITGHQNIISFINAISLQNNKIALVSEFADGGTLTELVKNNGGLLPVDQSIKIIFQVLDGLDYLHSKNMIHRDIKPDNILIKNGVICLADFGVSKLVATGLTQSVVSGTPAYMSPESFQGYRNSQTDIWSVGVVFYQLLTGRLPFAGNDSFSLIHSIISNNINPLPDGVPIPIREVILCALEKDVSKRYKTIEEMKVALDAAKPFIETNYLIEKIRRLEKDKELTEWSSNWAKEGLRKIFSENVLVKIQDIVHLMELFHLATRKFLILSNAIFLLILIALAVFSTIWRFNLEIFGVNSGFGSGFLISSFCFSVCFSVWWGISFTLHNKNSLETVKYIFSKEIPKIMKEKEKEYSLTENNTNTSVPN